jgi:hypothetical protein
MRLAGEAVAILDRSHRGPSVHPGPPRMHDSPRSAPTASTVVLAAGTVSRGIRSQFESGVPPRWATHFPALRKATFDSAGFDWSRWSCHPGARAL